MNKWRALQPFVRWAGGKRQLLPELMKVLPERYNYYHEPFVGGGALLFNLLPNQFVINDTNRELITAYRNIKNNVDDLVESIHEIEVLPNTREVYENLRDEYNEHIMNNKYDVRLSALFITLNARCFNSLYRVNKKGLFNSPWNKNTRPTVLIDCDNLRNINKYFKSCDMAIFCSDFEEVLQLPRHGDVCFIDSPYVPLSDTANFTRYTKEGFDMADHERLAECYHDLTERCVASILTNHDTPLTRKWYEGFDIKKVYAHRSINCKGNKRDGSEIIVTNF